jgi:hypothetical protein
MDPKNNGKPWTASAVQKLGELAKGNTPTRIIALKLQRTPAAVQAKASAESIRSSPPTNHPTTAASRNGPGAPN